MGTRHLYYSLTGPSFAVWGMRSGICFCLEGPKGAIFDRFDLRWFYTIKSVRVAYFGAKI